MQELETNPLSVTQCALAKPCRDGLQTRSAVLYVPTLPISPLRSYLVCREHGLFPLSTINIDDAWFHQTMQRSVKEKGAPYCDYSSLSTYPRFCREDLDIEQLFK